MERLNQRMLAGMSHSRRVALVGPRGCSSHAPTLADVLEVPAAPVWRFLAASMFRALQLAFRNRPGVVLAGSGLTAPIAWIAARVTGAKCAVYLHGLDVIVPSRTYQLLWLPLIRRCDMAIANSCNTARLAVQRRIDPKRVHVVRPGTDIPRLDPGSRQRFRRFHGIGNRPLLLAVGRLTPRKGLAEFVRHALPAILATQPEALMLVIGHDACDAIAEVGSRLSQRQRILEAARAAGVEHAVRLMPPCDDSTLSDAYSAADVHVFPILDVPGDVEGFGMVAVEAAAHGLPTVAFQVGGVADAIVEGITGSVVKPGDYASIAASADEWMYATDGMRRECIAAARQFGWDRFDLAIRSVLDGIQQRRD
jgi:phosphatidylinositol alpha-1,6-mannosyltransferase